MIDSRLSLCHSREVVMGILTLGKVLRTAVNISLHAGGAGCVICDSDRSWCLQRFSLSVRRVRKELSKLPKPPQRMELL